MERPTTGAAPVPRALSTSRRPHGDRTLVVVRGEVDHESREVLHRCLLSALGDSAGGIVLDLAEVSFWDCSSLNVLLTVRRLALCAGKTVTVRAAGPCVRRVLELTGTLPLFTPGTDN
ncbi:STAS domain-containing protein [Streptomyces sp. NPDC047017]|uniref:STAS domain-containing protein n=1 Tax=Streptomyces sp. NPDC047017 TaxID=3155024 RepID=UPI0033EF7326